MSLTRDMRLARVALKHAPIDVLVESDNEAVMVAAHAKGIVMGWPPDMTRDYVRGVAELVASVIGVDTSRLDEVGSFLVGRKVSL